MAVISCHCGSRFRVGDEWIGKQARCPACSTVVPVPEPEPAAVQSPAQAASEAFAPPPLPPAPEPAAASTADDHFAPPPVVDSVVETPLPPEATRSRDDHAPEPHRQASVAGEPQDVSGVLLPKRRGPTQLHDWLRPLLFVSAGLAALILAMLGIYALSISSRARPLPANGELVASTNAAASSNNREEEPGGEARIAPPAVPANTDVPQPIPQPIPLPNPLPNLAPVTTAPPAETEPIASSGAASGTEGVSKAGERPRPQAGGGLAGISNQYDDPHCQKLQRRFAWRVPAAAEFVEVNGERLPIIGFDSLRKVRAPYLFLPRGEHAIRLRAGELPIRVAIDDHLAATDSAMRGFFDLGGSVHRQDLLARAARAMDVHGAPFLLNMMGAASIADGEWSAAERKFRRSLLVNPFFGPAHLNLAVCLFRRNDAEAGIRELRLADALNVGNVFGLSRAITDLRRQHVPPDAAFEPIPLDVEQYVSSELLTVEDKRLIALMTAMAKYAVREEDRGKILNNLAVHFSETGKAETALEHFRSALAALKLAGPDRFALAEKVLSHMENACRRSDFPEAEEYAFMRKSVLP